LIKTTVNQITVNQITVNQITVDVALIRYHRGGIVWDVSVGEVEYAKREACHRFDKLVDVTGFVGRHTGYYYEMLGCIEEPLPVEDSDDVISDVEDEDLEGEDLEGEDLEGEDLEDVIKEADGDVDKK